MRLGPIPQLYRNINRLSHIFAVLCKYGLADWIQRLDLDFAKGFLRNPDGELLSQHSFESRTRMALCELGVTFIKIGQILGTRPDLVGRELAKELENLQTAAPADSFEVVRGFIEKELGAPLNEIFESFDPVPIASASIGQVHQAVLPNGAYVVVKVRHPHIERTIRVDLEILTALATRAESFPDLALIRPASLIAEFQRMLLRELDFRRELRNMQRIAADFVDNKHIRIPTPYVEFSSQGVLTMERLDGVKLSDREGMERIRCDRAALAQHGATMFLDMLFLHGFYHADPHPGNLMVVGGDSLGLLDFGMVGELDHELREDFEDLLIAVSTRDADRLTDVITRIGAVPQNLERASLALEISDYVNHYGTQGMHDFDLGGALGEMMDIVRRYKIRLPARVAMLIKLFLVLEGTSQRLSPKFNLLDVIQPYRRRMIMRRMSPARQARKMVRILSEAERLAQTLPRRLGDLLQQIESGRFDVHLDHRGLEPSVNRLVLGLLTSALLVSASTLLANQVPPMWRGLSAPGLVGMGVGLALGLWLLRIIYRIDRPKSGSP